MSSSLSSIRQAGNVCAGRRDWHADNIVQSADGVESGEPLTGRRNKLRRFWKRTRIPSVVKKVVEGSKLLLNRLNPRSTPHPPFPEPMQSGMNDAADSRVEIVKFPDYMIPSPADSSNEAYHSASPLAAAVADSDLGNAVQNSIPATTSAYHRTTNDQPNGDAPTPLDTSEERSFGGYRYRETLGKQKTFPEITLGVVSCRVKWLEPLLSSSCQQNNGARQEASDKATKNTPPELEIRDTSGLAPMMDGNRVENSRCSPQSDENSVFDDSPRLFKHRLPEQEPKPWVEPGTVAKGANWLRLQPVLSGAKRSGSGSSSSENHQGDLKSPTRITHKAFC